MRDYLFCRLNSQGAPKTGRVMAFASDAEAIQRALAPDFPHGCDLWETYRLVGRICGPARRMEVVTDIAA